MTWLGSSIGTFVLALLACFAAATENVTESVLRAQLEFTEHDLNVAVRVAEEMISKWHRLESNLVGSGIKVRENTPSHGQLIESYPLDEALELGKTALVANKASLYLIQKHCRQSFISLSDCLEELSKASLSLTTLGDKCNEQFQTANCSGLGLYRTYDGSCNNVQSSARGKSLTPYRRVLPARYSNGVNQPVRSVSRKPLPPPRLISNILISDFDKQEKSTTLAFVQWTQFIGNDLFHTPTRKMIHEDTSIECCQDDGRNLSPRFLHPQCQPISIPENDPDYSQDRTLCMNYVRSMTSLNDKCTFGPANQMNQATHFLDASMIYGSTEKMAESLRSRENGKMVTTKTGNGELLPMADEPESSCQLKDKKVCYKSGDSRVNMHPHHTAMYTIWVREHNRIAEALSKINPDWSDDTLFEEARRIVIAEIQHITYRHWLPHVLGHEMTDESNLSVKTRGFGNVYSGDVDPSISNSFATAGLTFVNSMLQSELRLYDDRGYHNDTLFLKDYFNRPFLLQEPEMFKQLVRGLAYETAQKMDASYVKDVTNYLFRGSNGLGQDIASLDIQRSRDHGLPGYNSFRKFCNMSSTDQFETFMDSMSESNLNKLKSVYHHPDDVDLLVGAVLETPKHGAHVGPVFQCIIREQMLRTRFGDRYFYDSGGKPHSFKEGQINEIKKVTLSRIICDNVDGINKIQLNVFNVPSQKNPTVDCENVTAMPRPNLNMWKSKV